MKVLLIEDERKVSSLVRKGLEAQGFVVDVSTRGDDGYELATSRPYDVLVLDIMLPGRDGLSILRNLRDRKMAVPVILLTARSELNARTAIDDKVELFETGADDYLTKPCSLAELMVRVKALLRRPSGGRSYSLRVGDLEVDRLSQEAKRAGKRLDLSGKEYALLEYLAAHAGRALSRTMIIEHVWDENFQSLTSIVDVYVRHLRSKVDDPFPSKLIHTVRGVGYSLSAPEAKS